MDLVDIIREWIKENKLDYIIHNTAGFRMDEFGWIGYTTSSNGNGLYIYNDDVRYHTTVIPSNSVPINEEIGERIKDNYFKIRASDPKFFSKLKRLFDEKFYIVTCSNNSAAFTIVPDLQSTLLDW
jgi:hypothetical protein